MMFNKSGTTSLLFLQSSLCSDLERFEPLKSCMGFTSMNLSKEGEEEFTVPLLQMEEDNVDLRKEFPGTAEDCVSFGCLLSQERFAVLGEVCQGDT